MEAAIKERVDQLTKSPVDTRDYRFIRLQNDIKVLLISDKDTDKAAAALSVNVGEFNYVVNSPCKYNMMSLGYMSDPDGIPGLAHLCEHMLFLGTDKVCDYHALITCVECVYVVVTTTAGSVFVYTIALIW